MLPESRAELIKSLEQIEDEVALRFAQRAVQSWWFHSAPKKEKGKNKRMAYGSELEPLSFVALMTLAATTSERDGEPTPKDVKAGEEWFGVRKALWRREHQGMADDEPEAQEAFRAIVESRAAANRAKNYPALDWEWDDARDHLGNLATMERAFRLYKGDAV